jgi:hypothetical protein
MPTFDENMAKLKTDIEDLGDTMDTVLTDLRAVTPPPPPTLVRLAENVVMAFNAPPSNTRADGIAVAVMAMRTYLAKPQPESVGESPTPPTLVRLVREFLRGLDSLHGGNADALRTYLATMPAEPPIPNESAAVEACRNVSTAFPESSSVNWGLTNDQIHAIASCHVALSGHAPDPDWRGMCEKLADTTYMGARHEITEQICDAVCATRDGDPLPSSQPTPDWRGMCEKLVAEWGSARSTVRYQFVDAMDLVSTAVRAEREAEKTPTGIDATTGRIFKLPTP